MGALRARVLGVALILASTGLGATPAHADGGEFHCTTTLNLAAGSGVTNCTGTATGVVNGVPGEHDFVADVAYSAVGCPLLVTASGTVTMDGIYYANVSAIMVGSVFVAALSNGHPGWGWGAVTPGDVDPALCSAAVTVIARGVFVTT